MKILIVDDSKMNLKIAEDALRTMPYELEIITAIDAEEALDIIENDGVDLILLDIIMPGLSGVDMLREMKEEKLLDQIKVIMMTTVDDVHIFKECFELGALDYIHKPFNGVEFSARIQSAIHMIQEQKQLFDMTKITEKKNNELLKLNQELSETQNYLIEKGKITIIGRLVGGLMNEIQEPLQEIDDVISETFTEISHFDKMMSINEVIDRQQCLLPKLETAKQISERISKVIEELEREANSSIRSGYSYVKTSEAIEQAIMLLTHELRMIQVVEKDYKEEGLIYANRGELIEAIICVMMNAIDACKDRKDSIIRLKTYDFEAHTFIVIEDNGEGLARVQDTKLFQPFYTTKWRQNNIGLGLSIVYDIIVNRHGGHVELSTDSLMTRCVITLKK